MKFPNLLIPFAILIIVDTIKIANGARILFFLGLSSHSHRVAIQPLATKLADLGHEITIFSPIKPEVPNPKIRDYCPKVLQDLNDLVIKSIGDATDRLRDRNFDPLGKNKLWDRILPAVEVTLGSPEFQEWLRNSRFDLIIHDHPGKEYIYAYAYQIKAKVIAFSPISIILPNDYDVFGFSIESWLNRDKLPINLKWSDRIVNAFDSISWHLKYRDHFLGKVEGLARKAFKFDFPPLLELMRKNTELYLVNEHFSSSLARPLPPNIIPVGGMHCRDSNGTLPLKIENFLADTEQFIYISFGSVIKLALLPLEVQQYFFNAVKSFSKTKFLWKWDGELPGDFPKNAFPSEWFPQQDVLAHPKCKGFMTQGGQMSMQQAIYHGVPVIVTPALADQPFNAKMSEYHEFGIHLELMDITKESLVSAFEQILNNPKYINGAKITSQRFKDRQVSPVDTAVWWVEYVLRHDDTSHLKSEGHFLTWYERRCLDVWVPLACLFTLLIVVIAIFMSKYFFGKAAPKQKFN